MAANQQPDALFETAAGREFTLSEMSFAEPDLAVSNNIYRAAHLVEVLHRFDVLPNHEDWLQAARRPGTALHEILSVDGPRQAQKFIRERQKQYDQTLAEAETHFNKAIGARLLTESGAMRPVQAKAFARQEYDRFQARYRGVSPARYQKRAAYRELLQAVVDNRPPMSENLPPAADRAMPVKPKAPVALARMLRPQFQGLNPANYTEVSHADQLRYGPAQLRRHLIDVPAHSTNAVRLYDDARPGRFIYITPTPEEWKLLRSTNKLGEAGQNHVEISRQNSFGRVIGAQAVAATMPDSDAPRRGGIHAVESRLAKIDSYLANVIDPSLNLIGQFEEALRYNAGLARFGHELGGRIKLTQLQTGTIEPMLRAAAVQWGISRPDQRLHMRRSLEKYVYFAPTTTIRRQRFGEMLELARDWRMAVRGSLLSEKTSGIRFIKSRQRVV